MKLSRIIHARSDNNSGFRPELPGTEANYTLENFKMRKIILALLIFAAFYAMNVWAQSPVSADDVAAMPVAETTEKAGLSFVGGFLILLSIGVGVIARKIYNYRSLLE